VGRIRDPVKFPAPGKPRLVGPGPEPGGSPGFRLSPGAGSGSVRPPSFTEVKPPMKLGSPRMGIGTRIRGRLGGFRTPGAGVGVPWWNPVQDIMDIYHRIRDGEWPDTRCWYLDISPHRPHNPDGSPIITRRESPGRVRSAVARRRHAHTVPSGRGRGPS
jgi:hypothetical protein